MATIGVDFGSSYSTVAYFDKEGIIKTVDFRDCFPANKYPSAILCKGKDDFMFGPWAQGHLSNVMNVASATERIKWMSLFIPNMKTEMKPNASKVFDGVVYSYQEILTRYLKNLIEQAQEDCSEIKGNIDKIVFSYPVNYEEEKIKMMEKAFHQLGFSNVEAVYEPVAAVKGYGKNNPISEGTGILVFDFGGGTIDVAYVKNIYGSLQNMSLPKGRNDCGGNDLDVLIYKYLRNQIKQELHIDISSEKDLTDPIILRECRLLKERLNNPANQKEKDKTMVSIWRGGKPINFEFVLSKKVLNTIISSKVEEAILVAKEVIDDVKRKGLNIDKVLLIGGSSLLSLVRERLTEVLKDVPLESFVGADIAVAIGTLTEENLIMPPPAPNNPEPREKPSLVMFGRKMNCT